MNESPSSSRRSPFEAQLDHWVPADHMAEGEQQIWTVEPDGSITIRLPSVLAANLADELLLWEERGACWVEREDCQNWRRSPIARENRRETIVYGNLLGVIQCLLGRRATRALMNRIRALDAVQKGNR